MATRGWLAFLLGLLFFHVSLHAAEPTAAEKVLQTNLEAVESTLRAEIGREKEGELLLEQVQKAVAKKNVFAAEELLEKSVFCIVTINPEGRVKVARGAGELSLLQNKPTIALVQVFNQSGGQQTLAVKSSYFGASKNPFAVGLVEKESKLSAALSGAEMEYRLMFVQCATPGKREITLHWNAGQGTQDIGFRGEVSILLDVKKL